MNTLNKPLRSGITGGFIYSCEYEYRGAIVDRFQMCNVIPQQWMDFLAALILGDETPIANWYIGIYEHNYVPESSVRATDLQTLVGESQAYASATRPRWEAVWDGTAVLDNLAQRVEFEITQDKTLYGSFICSDSTKGGSSGILASCARFPSPRSVQAGGVFRFAAGLTLLPTNLI
jgi:hypothetical protein